MDKIPFYKTTVFTTFTAVWVVAGVSFAIYYFLKRRKSEETYSLIGKMFIIYLFPPAAYFLFKNKKP